MLSHVHKSPSGDANTGPRAMLQDVHLACLDVSGVVQGTLVAAPDSGGATNWKEHLANNFFCRAFAALDANNYVEKPLQKLDGTREVSPIQHKELLETLSADMEQLAHTIGPIRLAQIAGDLLFVEHRCLWCCRTKAHQNYASTITCDVCTVATYCSNEHKENAKTAHNGPTDEAGRTECDILRMFMQSGTPSSHTKREVLLWASNSTIPEAVSDLPDWWMAYLSPTGSSYMLTPSILRAVVSSGMSPALTILDALRRFDFTTSFLKDELVIHLLGAEPGFEAKHENTMFEELAHQLPSIKRLVVNFVGPQIDQSPNDHDIPWATCGTCSASERMITFVKSKVQYHDYVSCNSYITPTLVVALNPGLCQPTLEWARTIRSLAAANVPCVFTSYNRDEAALDAQCVEGMGAKIVWQEERNRWTGQRVPSDYLGEELCRFENAFTLGFWGTTGV